MATINCRTCRNKLGETIGDMFLSVVRGRSILAQNVVRIECEKCGTIWEPVVIVSPPGPVAVRTGEDFKENHFENK